MWLDRETFKFIVAHTPLIAIDLIVENEKGSFLLGKRRYPPAAKHFFVPGGRILKGESIEKAFGRITVQELGTKIPLDSARFLGVFEHFYDESLFGKEISTHYVVLAYRLNAPDDLFLPYIQHVEYIWLTVDEILARDDVHLYTKNYFREAL